MKEIKIQSKKRIIELFIKNSIFFRITKLLLNPKKLIKKIVNHKYDLSKIKKIDWEKRSQNLGKYSVIDSQTPKNEFNYVTKLQKEFLMNNLKNLITGNEKKILDFGCGTGRFSGDLGKLLKKSKVLAVDTEKNLIKMAKKNKNVKYLHIRSLRDIKGKFNIIFIANVLGGIETKKLTLISNFICKSLKNKGILLLNENTSEKIMPKKEILKEWSSGNEEFYIKLFAKINLKKVDAYKYLQSTSSIFVGKK